MELLGSLGRASDLLRFEGLCIVSAQVCLGYYMGVSEKYCTLFGGPYHKDPTIQGTILGAPIFGNAHI